MRNFKFKECKLNKILLSGFVTMLVGGTLFAQIERVEVTPMVGKKIYNYSDDKPRFDDGKVVFGGRVNAYFNDTTSLQLGVEGSKDNPIYKPNVTGATTDLLRGTVSIQKDIPNRSRITPYVFAGFGGEKIYNTEPSTNVDSQMFYNGGAGLKYYVNENVDLVAETRVIHKVEDQDTDLIGNVGLGLKFGGRKQNVKTLDDLRAQIPQRPVTVAKPVILPAEQVTQAPVMAEPEPVIVGSLDEKEMAVNADLDGDCAPVDITDGCESDRADMDRSVGLSHGYYIQVISLSRTSPRKITSRLNRAGFSYTIENARSAKRVLVGPYSSRAAASRALRKLRRIKRDAFIVKK